jgi:hypothetical protein
MFFKPIVYAGGGGHVHGGAHGVQGEWEREGRTEEGGRLKKMFLVLSSCSSKCAHRVGGIRWNIANGRFQPVQRVHRHYSGHGQF